MNLHLTDHQYGKAQTRILKVIRGSQGRQITEVKIDLVCRGDFDVAFSGDNRGLITTDTMKNLVRALAKTESLEPIDDFGCQVSEQFLRRYRQITQVELSILETPWSAVRSTGQSVATTFERQAGKRVSMVSASSDRCEVRSGIEGLELLKTWGSAFAGFLRDEYTTLGDVDDRLIRTRLSAWWNVASAKPAYSEIWRAARRILVETFAAHESRSVQHTLFAMAEAVLGDIPEIRQIHLSLPNLHCWEINLAPFGLINDCQLFEPIDEPFGTIEATVSRDE